MKPVGERTKLILGGFRSIHMRPQSAIEPDGKPEKQCRCNAKIERSNNPADDKPMRDERTMANERGVRQPDEFQRTPAPQLGRVEIEIARAGEPGKNESPSEESGERELGMIHKAEIDAIGDSDRDDGDDVVCASVRHSVLFPSQIWK